MSAPITEAHRKLRETLEIRWMRATELEIEQLIADSEAAAVEAADFALQQERNIHMTTIAERDRLRAEVELGEQLQAATEASLKTVTGERDQLRAEVARLSEWQAGVIKNARAHHAHLKDAIARAERAEASLHALRLVCGTTDADKFSTWVDRAIARADRAETELAVERARLDWLRDNVEEIYSKDQHGIVYLSGDNIRAAIDAAMKEGAK